LRKCRIKENGDTLDFASRQGKGSWKEEGKNKIEGKDRGKERKGKRMGIAHLLISAQNLHCRRTIFASNDETMFTNTFADRFFDVTRTFYAFLSCVLCFYTTLD